MATKLLNRYLHIMVEEANKCTMKAKLSACILSNNKIICPPCCNTERNVYRCTMNGSIHAETRAILKYFGKNISFNPQTKRWSILQNRSKLNLDLFVIRINNNGLVISRPCYECLTLMKQVGVRRVYYTTGIDDEVICENVEDMLCIYLSTVTLNLHNNISINNKNSRNIYYQNMFMNIIQHNKKVKLININYFIKYNFSIYCPNYTYVIHRNRNHSKISFYDEKGQFIIDINIE